MGLLVLPQPRLAHSHRRGGKSRLEILAGSPLFLLFSWKREWKSASTLLHHHSFHDRQSPCRSLHPAGTISQGGDLLQGCPKSFLGVSKIQLFIALASSTHKAVSAGSPGRVLLRESCGDSIFCQVQRVTSIPKHCRFGVFWSPLFLQGRHQERS